MKHYNFLDDAQRKTLFFKEPEEFKVSSETSLLSSSLGATLYTPATRPNLMSDVRKMALKGATSLVICLEDSVPDELLEEAEANVVNFLEELNQNSAEDLPLLFIRVRNPEHLAKVASQNKGKLGALTGFVFPKFEDFSGAATEFLYLLNSINKDYDRPLYFMPVLESPNLIWRETRDVALAGIKKILDENRELVLAVRIGATDMSGVYGLRRSPDFTIYNVHALASVIADIVNVFGRFGDGYTITGAVWEHFDSVDRIFKPQLRETPFHDDEKLRRSLLTEGNDMFIKEIRLDGINGLFGKTIIHPSHIGLVHAFSVVTHEEYSDALALTSEVKQGGATASVYHNRMNEAKPHFAWAQRILIRARAFGVANPNIDFVDFLEASRRG